ncbi:MAG: UDP-glucose 4-epimerase GalE [Phycisphaerales bacterium]|nr:UDP-glucose 4-epimerase GalE [Phycisphaerales bacterium]
MILVTGGAGYIGSHAVQRLLRDGQSVVVLDNLHRGHASAIELLKHEVAKGKPSPTLALVEGEIGDYDLVLDVLKEYGVREAMHFAALAYVGESVTRPLVYYRNNTASALSLLEACDAAAVERIVFSSTCATYGEPSADQIPIPESCVQRPINPYGWSKLHTERMLLDYSAQRRNAGRPVGLAILRYFNVAGSDRVGVLGEHHHPETHLVPVVLQSLLGTRGNFGGPAGEEGRALTVFGTDYPTPDGTCIRDYVHVEDLVDAHLAVLRALRPGEDRIYNLGIGRGYSVREIIASCERVTGLRVNVKEGPRRPGDPPALYADPTKIHREIGWRASITDLDEIVRSAWEWFRKHPAGYQTGL